MPELQQTWPQCALRALAGLALVAWQAAHAAPSVPWMPSAPARHAIALLVDEAGLALPMTQWPLPQAAVERALEALPPVLPPALDEARERVDAELHRHGRAEVSVALRGRDDTLVGFGDEGTPGSSVGLRSPTWALPGLALQVGARAGAAAQPDRTGPQLRLDDSALVVEGGGVQLQAWSHRTWWSPGWQSSLLLGNNAPPFNGVGLQRAVASPPESGWLAWTGPMSYDFFVAQTDDDLRSYLVGMRLTLRPFSMLEIGLTRTAQWGGRGHSQTLKSFVKMLLGMRLNAQGPAQQAADPANEMAGIDLRLRCPRGVRCATYAQLVAEDEGGHVPTRYLGLFGIESWSADGRERYFGEFAETICGAFPGYNPIRRCAYRNYAYPEGYAHAGRWIGAGVGPDSRLLTLGWMHGEDGTDTSLRVHAGTVASRIAVFAPTDDPVNSGRLVGAAARRSWQRGHTTWTAEADWLRIAAAQGDHTDARIGLTWHMPMP